jgi:uncharacterized protein (TIGR02246 family)
MKTRLIFFLVSTFGCMICFPFESFSQEPREAEIRKRVQEYENGYNSGDAKATAAIYAEYGSHTYVNGMINRGRLEIEKGLAESFAGPMKGTQIKITPDVIQFPADNVAIEEASFVLTGLKMPDGKDVPALKGFCLAVYKKQQKDWFAVTVQCMVPLTPPN